MSNRQPIDGQVLANLVIDLLAAWRAQQKDFTAADVKDALRLANPNLEIAHDDVRALVVAEMDTYIQNQTWTVSNEPRGGHHPRVWRIAQAAPSAQAAPVVVTNVASVAPATPPPAPVVATPATNGTTKLTWGNLD